MSKITSRKSSALEASKMRIDIYDKFNLMDLMNKAPYNKLKEAINDLKKCFVYCISAVVMVRGPASPPIKKSFLNREHDMPSSFISNSLN